MGKKKPTSAQALKARERAKKTYELRLQEKTYRQIAEIQECSISTVHQDIWNILEENKPTELVEHYRNEQTQMLLAQNESILARYRIAYAKELEALQKNDMHSASQYGRLADAHYGTWLRSLERIAKLNGVDAPTKHEFLTRTLEDHQAEIDQLIREQKAKMALESPNE